MDQHICSLWMRRWNVSMVDLAPEFQMFSASFWPSSIIELASAISISTASNVLILSHFEDPANTASLPAHSLSCLCTYCQSLLVNVAKTRFTIYPRYIAG